MANFNAGGNKKKAAAVRPPDGMFIFSKPMNKKSYLFSIEASFKKQGVKTKIVKDENGKYYLCREGIEARRY